MSNSEISTIIFGIDLGTTNTVISYFEDNKAKILTDGVYKLIPSKIYISSDNKIFCGNYIPIGAKDIIHSFKVDIGKKYKIIKNNKEYNISNILNIFINHIKSLIFKKFPKLNKIETVITVPSNFSDIQREIISSAFINNNCSIIRIINEPSAAALAYGLNQEGESKIMVIDTGGGTMDITILGRDCNFFQVIHSEGLNDLGGNNFTNIIVEYIVNKLNLEKIDNKYIDKQTNKEISKDSLFYTAQRIKEKLSYQEYYITNLKNIGIDYNLELSAKEFNKLSNKLLQRVDDLLSDILKNYKDVGYFILVGGSSKMKILQEKIYDITRKKPWYHPNLESVVSEGAALYAGIIKGYYKSEDDILLVDVLPLSLGVETADGNFSIIIPKNTPLPTKRVQRYTTDTPGDSNIKIKIYQGERKIANKNTLIGEIEFNKVSLTGIPIVEIAFRIDLNGLINIIILDKKSGIESNILLKDIPKYDESTLNKILEDAELNNEIDNEMVTKLQRIYIIKTKIENAIVNLSINELLSEETKKDIRIELNTIEENLEEKTNIDLLEIIYQIDEKYLGLTILNNLSDNDEHNNTKMDDLERVFINELKADILRRGDLLIAQNPDWTEFIKPLLEELELSNLTMEYLQDKLTALKELQDDDDNNISRDFKEELKNMCIYLKTEINEGQLELVEDKKNILIAILTETFEIIENNNEINWEDKMNEFNKYCEELYFK
jgi:molecular chaperone DnaK